MKDFELQRSGIQVIEFPCKGKAQIREGSALPGGCFQAPPCLSSGDPHAFQVFGSVFWYTSPLRSGLLHSPGPARPGSTLSGPIDLHKFDPHHTVAGSFGQGRCTPSHPFDLQRHQLMCSEQLQACAAAGPAPSAEPPEPRAGQVVSMPLLLY